MDEFAKACNISIDLDDFITESLSSSGKSLTTASLYDVYARRVVIRKLDQYAVSTTHSDWINRRGRRR